MAPGSGSIGEFDLDMHPNLRNKDSARVDQGEKEVNAPLHEHLVHETITIDVFYPDHPPRTESAVFAATKKHWHAQGAKCRTCGTDKKIEIHHRFIEWADTEGVDWDKVKAAHPDFDWSTFKEPADFIDSVYNTEPLCQLHHRGPAPFGKHFTPEPIYNMQAYMRNDFVYAPGGTKK